MIIKVSRNNIRIRIVRRVLNRAKFMYIIFKRYNDNSAGVLSRGALYSYAALNKSILLRALNAHSLLVKPFLDEAVSRLVGKSADSAGLENVLCAEKSLRIFMRLRLEITREVEVDIGLLIAVEAEEGLEGDVVAVHQHPSRMSGSPHISQFLGGRSKPEPIEPSMKKVLFLQCLHR